MDQDTHALRHIVTNLRDLVWLADAELETLRYVNPASEAVAGRSRERFVEEFLELSFVHPDDRERAREWRTKIRTDLRSGAWREAYSVEFRVTGDDGDERWLETVAIPVRDDRERPVGVVGQTTDVTGRKRREAHLEVRVERLDQFASTVSHDLRNPINVALGQLRLYRESGEADRLDAVEDALERIDDITTGLLTLAQDGIAAGGTTDVSLDAACTAAWEATDSRDATLVVESNRTVPANEGQFDMLLTNLFRNAVGHGGFDVTVRVGALPEGFYVEDTGDGIPPAEHERVFEYGYSTGYRGTGIGLAIVERIATAHGWTIELAESDEGGARFEFGLESEPEQSRESVESQPTKR